MMPAWRALLILLCMALFIGGTRAANIYVDQNCQSSWHDGTSWATAYLELAPVLPGTSGGNTIHVARGVYKPTTDSDRTATFQLISGVTLLGGYPTGGGQRDPAANETTLSGDIGVEYDDTDNSWHVVTASGTNNTAELDGFTVTGGNARNGATQGGGLYNDGGRAVLRNLVFTGNQAESQGGGLFISYDGGDLTLTRVTFSGNQANYGGGMYCGGNPTLTDVTFSGNQAADNGGGLWSDNGSPSLTNMTFSDNTAGSLGGGMICQHGDTVLTNVTFSGNQAEKGGGIFCGVGTVTLTNVTISGNSATAWHGGGLYALGTVTVRNAICWGNTAANGAQLYRHPNGALALSDCVVQDGYAEGTNIITADPLLGALGDNGGYTQTISIPLGSSALNAASAAVAPNTDQRGMNRSGPPDIGAFEYQIMLRVLSPSDGETWYGGEVRQIRWESELDGLVKVELMYADYVPFPNPPVWDNMPATGETDWDVHIRDTPGMNGCIVRITSLEYPGFKVEQGFMVYQRAITGYVRKQDGTPVAGVTVTATGPLTRAGATGANGYYRLMDTPPGDYLVQPVVTCEPQNRTLTLPADTSSNINFTFLEVAYTVTPAAGAHGAISPDTPQTVDNGEDAGFTATPDAGYTVDKWYVDGVEAQAGGDGFTLSGVTADRAVEVTFKIITLTVTAGAGVGGSISPSGENTVDYGGYIFFTAAPNAGYGVQKWQLDGVDAQTGGATFELNNVTADRDVQVSFGTYSAPMLIGIAPNTHLNTGRLSSNILGMNFRTGIAVQLTKTGQSAITAKNVAVAANTLISCDFNFNGNAAGAWNLVVTNDDGKSATLANAVTLSLAPPAIASITPDAGVNIGAVAVTNLAGSGFDNPTVELRKTGETAIPMTGVTLFGPTKITGSFDLTGAASGAWDVVVTNADDQSATLAEGFTIGDEPPPAPASISPASMQKPGTKTLTVNGTNFADDAVMKLTKSGEPDFALTMTSRSSTRLRGSIDISSMTIGQWNVVVTNHPGAGNERSATMSDALAIVEPALTGVTLATDKAWPQPEGAVITLTAIKSGTADNIEYQFWVKTLNRLTSLPEYALLRDYDTANTFAWKPAADSYWLYVIAREVGSESPGQVVSPEVYFKIEVATLTGVTLAVTPTTSPQPVGTTFTLTATQTGTAVDVEYRFVCKWYNPAKGKWEDFDIRGYAANNTCAWTPTVTGQYRLYAMARVVGSTALFDRISPFKAYIIQP